MKCVSCKTEMKLVKTDFSTPFGDIDITIHDNGAWKCSRCGRKIYNLDKYARIQKIGYETYKKE